MEKSGAGQGLRLAQQGVGIGAVVDQMGGQGRLGGRQAPDVQVVHGA